MAKNITVIPATKPMFSNAPVAEKARRRVAAYARVSTDSDEQFTSYEAQVDYYSKLIQSRPDWIFAGMYADSGITGTNTKQRDGFKSMVADALDGKIDLILTKSVSRFARNTVDSLVTVRELKANNVEVYFEKENIYTFDSKGELLITIMSSLAQEESRSISENVKWGWRKRIADGKVSMAYSQFLGYERGADGKPQIVESEAKIVRYIYKTFLEGKTPSYIARALTEANVPTPRGGSKWSPSTIGSILRNEKYKGSALLQKTFTVDFLTKTTKKNEGEIDQYYIEDSHPAIVSKEVFDMTQLELERRSKSRNYKPTASIFSGLIYCGECGSMYGSKVWHSNSKYRRVIWQCNNKFKNAEKCGTPHLTDEKIKTAFVEVFNDLIDGVGEVIGIVAETIDRLLDTTEIDKKLNKAKRNVAEKSKAAQDYMKLGMSTEIPAEEYNSTFAELMAECEAAQRVQTKWEQEKASRIDRSRKCAAFINQIKGRGVIEDFDEALFGSIVDKISVFRDKIVFEFKDGETKEYILK